MWLACTSGAPADPDMRDAGPAAAGTGGSAAGSGGASAGGVAGVSAGAGGAPSAAGGGTSPLGGAGESPRAGAGGRAQPGGAGSGGQGGTAVAGAAGASPPRDGTSSVGPDGVIRWDDVPAFPIGVYYNGRARTPAQIDQDLAVIAAAGFNAVEASQIQAWTDAARFFDACQRLGLRASVEVNVASPASAETFVRKWKAHPAVWAWDVADDSHRRFTVDEVRAMNANVKAWDPKHLTSQTVYDPAKMGPYMALTDMVWPYRYPVYDKAEGSDLGVVQWIMNAARGYDVPLMGIPQAYRWGEHPGDRFPSPAEYRNLAWQFIIGGARGLLSYSFTDSGLLSTVAPELWAAMAKVNEEIEPFLPFLRLGTYVPPSTADEDVKAAFWKMGPACLVAIENHRTSSRDLSIAVPAGCTGTKLTGEDATGVTLRAGGLSGTQAALRVRRFYLQP